MKRPHQPRRRSTLPYALMLVALGVLPSTGCLHLLLASGIYLWEGGNVAPPECDALAGHRVVVFCPPPPSSEYRHAGASRELAKRVNSLLTQHGEDIDVVDPKEVDNWMDENGGDDHLALGKAVGADRVLRIELEHFDLFKGQTLYQGVAEVTLSVYDLADDGSEVWSKVMGEFKFPTHSGIPSQDKSQRQFQREFVEVLAASIGRHFHEHDPHADFAIDATANR